MISEAQQTEEIEAESKETSEIESLLVPSGEIAEASKGFDAAKSVECPVTNETTENDESFIPETQCDTTTDLRMENSNSDNEEIETNVSQIENEKSDVLKCDDLFTMPPSHELVDNSPVTNTDDEIIAKTINQMETAESVDVNSKSIMADEEQIQEDVVRFENEEMSTNEATEESLSLSVFVNEDVVNNGLVVDSTVPKSGEESNAEISNEIKLEQPISERVVVVEMQIVNSEECEMINNSQTDESLVENNEKGENEPKTKESLKHTETDVFANVTLVSEVPNGPDNNGEEVSFAVDSEITSSTNEDMHCEQLDNENKNKLQDSFFDTSSHYAKTESSAVSSMFNDSAQITEGIMDIFYYEICSQPIFLIV